MKEKNVSPRKKCFSGSQKRSQFSGLSIVRLLYENKEVPESKYGFHNPRPPSRKLRLARICIGKLRWRISVEDTKAKLNRK